MKQYLKNTFWLGLLGALVLIFLATTGKDAEAGVKDISNVNWKPSVHLGKEYKPYEIVKAKDGEPAIGKRSFKFTVMPYDCGYDPGGKWSDCDAGIVRARSEVGAWNDTFSSVKSERWISFSIFVPEDFQSAYPVKTSFFQIYKKKLGPIMMLRDLGSDRLVAQLKETASGYYSDGSSSTVSGVPTLIKISEMKGKWTHFKVHLRYTDEDDGFWKFYVNGELKYHVAGRTKGLVKTKNGLYLKAGLYQTGTDMYKKFHKGKDIPAQTIYIDNIYQTKTEEKLSKLINKAK